MKMREVYERCLSVKIKMNINDALLKKLYDEIREEMKTDKSALKQYINLYEEIYEFAKEQLGSIDYFKNTISYMNESLKGNDTSKIYDMMQYYMDLYEKIHCTTSLFQTIIGKSEESIGLEIKIPNCNDITEFKKYIDGLEFIFTKCPFFQSDDASLKLETVESGSICLIFGVTCASVTLASVLLNNIAAFIDKCFVIKSHSLSCKRQEQEIESAKIEQKEKEELLKSIHRLYKISVENAIRELQTSTGCPIQDGDEKGRAEQSMEKMATMLEQGLQIYATINSPKEVKALFAPLEMYYLSMRKEVEKIEEKAETDTE